MTRSYCKLSRRYQYITRELEANIAVIVPNYGLGKPGEALTQ